MDREGEGEARPATRGAVTYLILCLWALFSAVLGFLYSRIPPNVDESLFDYVGWICTQSGVPYRDAGDHDFPGMFFLHALARFLFDSPMWSFRSLDYLLLLAFCGQVYYSISRWQGRLTALVFVPLYQCMYVVAGPWMSGQRDLIGTHMVLSAGLMFLERIRGGRAAWVCGAAFLTWVAILVKPTFVVYTPVFLLIDLVTRRRLGRSFSVILRDQAIALAVMVGLTAFLLGSAWVSDALERGFDLAIRFNSEVYGRKRNSLLFIVSNILKSCIREWHWYIVFSAVGLYLWWRRGDRPTLILILYAQVATFGLVFLQGKGFFYHMSGMLPMLGLLIANALAWLIRGISMPSPWPRDKRKVFATLACAMAFYGIGSKLYRSYNYQCLWYLGKISTDEYFEHYELAELMRMARFVRSNSVPADTVWSYSTGIIVNVVAERRLPVRFAHPLITQNANPPFSRAAEWMAELETILRDHPPKFIILARDPDATTYQYLDNLKEGTISKLIKDTIDARYHLVYTAGIYDCFELKR